MQRQPSRPQIPLPPKSVPFAPSDPWSAEPAGLYLHVPFCSSICPYCDFAVLLGGAEERARFVDDLVAEIGRWRGSEALFDTIYLGGGTPSALAPEQIGRFLGTLRETFRLDPAVNVCMEVNPEDVDRSVLARWQEIGVDRVSLGIQSLDDDALRFLGRRHDARTARESIETVMQSGISSVSVDLIYALPDQSRERWRSTLETVASLAPHHLSCYELTVHEKTLFGVRARRGELVEVVEEERAELFLFTRDTLEARGYQGYEVSNFSRGPAFRSRHNQKYWRHVPYLGLGPSAHSFDGTRRWWNHRRLRDWRGAVERGESPLEGWEELEVAALVFERLMLGLRTSEGVDLDQLGGRLGRDLAATNRDLIARLVGDGRLEVDGSRLRPTPLGMLVADSLATAFEIPAPV